VTKVAEGDKMKSKKKGLKKREKGKRENNRRGQRGSSARQHRWVVVRESPIRKEEFKYNRKAM